MAVNVRLTYQQMGKWSWQSWRTRMSEVSHSQRFYNSPVRRIEIKISSESGSESELLQSHVSESDTISWYTACQEALQ